MLLRTVPLNQRAASGRNHVIRAGQNGEGAWILLVATACANIGRERV